MKYVVVVHGFLMKSPVMGVLGSRLAAQGYTPLYFNYRTLHFDRQRTLSRLEKLCEGLDEVYFVGHSMGGLVIRQFLQDKTDDKFKAVVTLGTPHKSSRFAQVIYNSGMNSLFGLNEHSGLISTLHEWNNKVIKIGSIAGQSPRGLFSLYQKIKREKSFGHDGTVFIEETIGNFDDHLVVDVSHTGLVYSSDVARQVGYFFDNFIFFR